MSLQPTREQKELFPVINELQKDNKNLKLEIFEIKELLFALDSIICNGIHILKDSPIHESIKRKIRK
uniref:hypothetical protein n=1 Tax=uncultured Draconibacterium sp. TaxID=1573823 RepID=UPI0032170A72